MRRKRAWAIAGATRRGRQQIAIVQSPPARSLRPACCGRRQEAGGHARNNVAKLPRDVDKLLLAIDERLHDVRIELRSIATQDDLTSLGMIEGRLVDTLARERVIHVRQGHDTTAQWDLISFQAARVAATVVALVMRDRDVSCHPQKLRIGPMVATLCNVSPPSSVCRCMIAISSGVRGPGLKHTQLGTSHFANIVQRAGLIDDCT